jgi:Family of unknown function (DUF6535)
LFSASVAALVAVSIQDLRPNSQDTSAFYLKNILQLLADPNISRASILSTPTEPPPFSPPKYAILVNSLWFLSLVISLTCALLATLLQQWARRYITITQLPRYTPHKRARIRAFFADGAEKYHLPWAVETLPTLLHISLFLFFFGLLIFLFNINHTTFTVVVWCVGVSSGVYGCITLMPIFRHDSPYYAPLSLSAWFLYTGVPYGFFRILEFITYFDSFRYTTWYRFHKLKKTYRERFFGGIFKAAQESASKLSAEIDGRVLRWTFEALDEDHELEQFFEGIPSFCGSSVVEEPKQIFAQLGRTLAAAFCGFLNSTWSSSLLSETIKERRFMVCMQAVDTLGDPFPSFDFVTEVFERGMDGVLRSAQFGHLLRSRCCGSDEETSLFAQWIVAGIIARVPERDYRWKALVMDQLGVSEDVFHDYLAHGDSVLLANLIHITRQSLCYYRPSWLSSTLLLTQGTISKFDIQNTLPGLQHDFCSLWNEIALEARNDQRLISFDILRPIRHLYIALHQGTDAAPTAFSASTPSNDAILLESSSFPLCNIPGHQPHIHDTTYPPTITSPTVRPPDTVLYTITPSTAPDPSSFPASTPDHSRIHPVDEPSPGNVSGATSIIGSFHSSPPFNLGNNHIPVTPLNSTQGPADTPTISPTTNSETDPRTPPAVSTFIPHSSFAPPSSNADDPKCNADLSVVPGIPLSSSPAAVPGDTLPTNLQSSLASPVSLNDQVIVGSGLLPSASATAISLTRPQGTPASQPIMAPHDEEFVAHHNSGAPDLYNNVEASQRSQPLAKSIIPDIATDLSHHSLDTVPSSSGIGRPE